jgi:hypothetical protein
VFGTPRGLEMDGAASVGGGIRFHYEYGGVQPGVIAIDIGVPIRRTSEVYSVDGVFVRNRAPVGFYVAFDQFF